MIIIIMSMVWQNYIIKFALHSCMLLVTINYFIYFLCFFYMVFNKIIIINVNV